MKPANTETQDRETLSVSTEQAQMLDNITEAVLFLNPDGKLTFANKAFETIFQKEKESVEGRKLLEVMTCLRETEFEQVLTELCNDGKITSFECYFPKLDKWLSVSTHKSQELLVVIARDTTLQKESNKVIEESEKIFHAIADNSPMFIWTAGKDLNPNFFNKTWIDYTGISNAELIKNGWNAVIHPDHYEPTVHAQRRIAAGKKELSFDCLIRRHDGEYRLINFNTKLMYGDRGDLTGIISNGVDITEINEARDKINSKNEELLLAFRETDRMVNIINKTPNIVVLTDVRGNLVWANEAFCNITEYTLEEAIDKNPNDLLKGPDTSAKTVKQVAESIEKNEFIRVEILNYAKSGKSFWLDLRIEPVYFDNELTGHLAIASDITQRKIDELAIKERNEKISKVSFITSHELRHEFSKIMMLMNESEAGDNTIEDYKTLFGHLKEPARLINSIISKINENLKHDIDNSLADSNGITKAVEEICLIEDDKLTNLINTKMIKRVLPDIPIKVYERIDCALDVIKAEPAVPRLIFLDLNLPEKSGWDFLEECQEMNLSSHVLMLTSSIDPKDIEKSKRYKMVEDYICKPLTVNAFEAYARKYCAA